MIKPEYYYPVVLSLGIFCNVAIILYFLNRNIFRIKILTAKLFFFSTLVALVATSTNLLESLHINKYISINKEILLAAYKVVQFSEPVYLVLFTAGLIVFGKKHLNAEN